MPIENAPAPLAVPEFNSALQVALLYMPTVALASAVPDTAGEALFEGLVGLVTISTGVAGATESSKYVKPMLVHADTLPAASVAEA